MLKFQKLQNFTILLLFLDAQMLNSSNILEISIFKSWKQTPILIFGFIIHGWSDGSKKN